MRIKTYYIDGGCRGNNQKDQSKREMISVVTDDKGRVLKEVGKWGGSNNIAEFYALQLALSQAMLENRKRVKIITDSQNTIGWSKGHIGKKINDKIRVLEILDQVQGFNETIDYILIWQPREENLAGQYIERIYNL